MWFKTVTFVSVAVLYLHLNAVKSEGSNPIDDLDAYVERIWRFRMLFNEVSANRFYSMVAQVTDFQNANLELKLSVYVLDQHFVDHTLIANRPQKQIDLLVAQLNAQALPTTNELNSTLTSLNRVRAPFNLAQTDNVNTLLNYIILNSIQGQVPFPFPQLYDIFAQLARMQESQKLTTKFWFIGRLEHYRGYEVLRTINGITSVTDFTELTPGRAFYRATNKLDSFIGRSLYFELTVYTLDQFYANTGNVAALRAGQENRFNLLQESLKQRKNELPSIEALANSANAIRNIRKEAFKYFSFSDTELNQVSQFLNYLILAKLTNTPLVSNEVTQTVGFLSQNGQQQLFQINLKVLLN